MSNTSLLKQIKNNSDLKAFLILSLFVFSIMFLVSQDSYLYDLYGRCDSAWFFMAGKAWMNGMIPYVDFSDSKGPLLWLIYGIGYLISNTTYIGVFWVSVILYTFTFFFYYKIANIFFNNNKISLSASFLMALAHFSLLYNETRSEDICQIFIASSLYFTLRLFFHKITTNEVLRTSFVLGIGFAGCLMIKFTIAAMLAIFALPIIWLAFTNNKKSLGYILLGGILGVSVITIPFIIYFIHLGNLNDFVNEYFFATLQTVNVSTNNIFTEYKLDLLHTVSNKNTLIIGLINFIGCIIFCIKNKEFKWFPLLFTFWFWAIAIKHNYWFYYTNACLGLSIFTIVVLFQYIANKISSKDIKWLLVEWCGICVLLLCLNIYRLYPIFFFRSHKNLFYEMTHQMSSVERPRILNLHHEIGIGISLNSLPACKYWAKQNGATPEMIEEQITTIRNNAADFIITHTPVEDSMTIKLLEPNYTLCYHVSSDSLPHTSYKLYRRNDILSPTDKIEISNLDVLLKRNIYGRKH